MCFKPHLKVVSGKKAELATHMPNFKRSELPTGGFCMNALLELLISFGKNPANSHRMYNLF